MKEPKWLLHEFVIAAHDMSLAQHGGPSGIRDEDLLESALSSARNKFVYEPKVSLFDLAAAYSYGIAMDHPFVDGNKRTALVCGMVFLEINGVEVNAPEVEAAIAFESLASGSLTEIDLATWYKAHSEA